jgi:hypothetical protein
MRKFLTSPTVASEASRVRKKYRRNRTMETSTSADAQNPSIGQETLEFCGTRRLIAVFVVGCPPFPWHSVREFQKGEGKSIFLLLLYIFLGVGIATG